MKFILWVKYLDSYEPPWAESCDRPEIKTEADANRWGRNIVKFYNDTLLPYEREREFVRIEWIGDESREHNWKKVNAITIKDKAGLYDRMRCEHCGITGKRFGLEGNIVRDHLFKANGYSDCDKAKKLLSRKSKRKEKK
jgi:hypothetical protein